MDSCAALQLLLVPTGSSNGRMGRRSGLQVRAAVAGGLHILRQGRRPELDEGPQAVQAKVGRPDVQRIHGARQRLLRGTVFQVAYLSGHYNWLCQGINYDNPSERDTEIMRLVWWYCLVRVADFLDTVFFVLRKKNSQITFLHVSHHAFIVFSGWFYMNFGTDGQPVIGVSVNALVHVIMYSYYFLAALGPSVQKYLWWKRYLTELQIVQFVGLMMHMSITLFYNCGYPRPLAIFALSQGFFGLLLFINFYVRNYVLRMTRAKGLGTVNKSD
ncbi:hypothetical protein HPB52_018575 [Rhipicephalus sanguineus]|uniref:Elongation of very long chain fatty acids protein n=1 Tax=Rhipicephalus sanguineus TaxID=34632 RepID=A0A9D4STM0_RHISA|nr:hypothetical protein HPB52_018575 [Rhipicephalus sanguineus]